MAKFTLTEQAQKDIRDIAQWISQANAQAAIKWLKIIEHHFSLLASQPLMGRIRPEFSIDARMFPFRNYMIFYDAVDDGIEVLHVLDGRQDIPNLPLRTIRSRPRQ
jgi:toxin ParE1/3/4